MKELREKLCTLKSNIKRIALTLCLLLTVCFSANSQPISRNIIPSDSTKITHITITSDQLRTANLIFAEHKELSTLVPLLQQENTNLRIINKSWERTDSLRRSQLYQKNQIIAQQSVELDKMEKSMNTTLITTGSITGAAIIVTILCLCLK